MPDEELKSGWAQIGTSQGVSIDLATPTDEDAPTQGYNLRRARSASLESVSIDSETPRVDDA